MRYMLPLPANFAFALSACAYGIADHGRSCDTEVQTCDYGLARMVDASPFRTDAPGLPASRAGRGFDAAGVRFRPSRPSRLGT
jgi:hypothetical protein